METTFNSSHEVYGVLMEEIAEFFDIVREKTIDVDKVIYPEMFEDKKCRMIDELTQIATVANRAAVELSQYKIKFV